MGDTPQPSDALELSEASSDELKSPRYNPLLEDSDEVVERGSNSWEDTPKRSNSNQQLHLSASPPENETWKNAIRPSNTNSNKRTGGLGQKRNRGLPSLDTTFANSSFDPTASLPSPTTQPDVPFNKATTENNNNALNNNTPRDAATKPDVRLNVEGQDKAKQSPAITPNMAAAGITAVGPKKRRTLNDISSEELRLLKDPQVSETEKMMAVLNNAKLRGHFRAYLQEALSVENLDFWLTVEEYKLLPSDAPEKAHRAQDIYQRFFTPQSRSEVNITAKMRDQIADRVVFHSDNLFDEPQKEVFALMLQNSLKSFLNSPFFKDFSAISEKLRQTEDAMRQEAREMKELKRKYMESQSRWRDMNVQRQVYLDLIRDLNVEAEGVKYILSVTVLEGDSICPRQESRYTYCYFEMGDQVFVTKPAEHHGKPVWREYFIFDVEEEHYLYIELRNRNIITADDYLGECVLNCMDLTGLAPTDLWVDVKDKNRNLTGGKVRLRIYCRHKMDALSEIEDMLMRLEALLEEEKRHHEMLKNYLLTHSGSVEEVVEVDYKSTRNRQKALDARLKEVKKQRDEMEAKSMASTIAMATRSGPNKSVSSRSIFKRK
jgi:hypothetical protein